MSDHTVTPPGGGGTPERGGAAPQNWAFTPGRYVQKDSRAEAMLRHAGLAPGDIPRDPANPTITVTPEEITAEITRRGLAVTIPEPLPALSERAARRYVGRMRRLGAHLIKLWAGTKTPVATEWQRSAPLSPEEAADWLVQGGNLGIVLGRSGVNGWVVLDAENIPATDLMLACGYIPTTVTANAQDRTHVKFGGCHVWMPLPVDADVSTLKARLTVPIGDGGKVDVLLGDHFIVAPGSRLDSAPGLRYEFSADGAGLDPAVWGIHDPRWLYDPEAPAPAVPGLERLHGCARRVEKVRRPRTAEGDDLTSSLDAVPWGEWIDGDPRVEIIGADGSCGCDVFHWADSSTARSGILHDGCEYGYAAHVFSGTLQAQLGGVEHITRLYFATFLRGLPPERCGDVAREVGIQMGRRPLQAIDLEDIEVARPRRVQPAPAATQPALGPVEECELPPTPPQRGITLDEIGVNAPPPHPPRLSAVPRIGTVGGGSPYVHGAAAPASPGESSDGADDAEAEPAQSPDPATALSATAADDPTAVIGDPEAANPTGVALGKAEEVMARADDPALLDAIFSTPLLQGIRRRAELAQVSPMTSLSANLNAIFSVVPPDVMLPRITGKNRSPLNMITVAVDESGGGKGGLTAVDIEPIPPVAGSPLTLPESFSGACTVPHPITVGSGEAISAAYSTVKQDKETGVFTSTNHTVSVWFAWDEVTKILAVRDRKSSTIEAELCQGFSGERLGSQTKTNPAWTDAGSYRFLASIAAQRVTATGLFANERVGLLQRIWWVSAAYRLSEEDAAPEKLAAGRRSADGQWFAEPEGTERRIPVTLPPWPTDKVIPVAADVAAEIEAARAAHGLGKKKHEWDRHEFQIRLRLAAGGAIMHGECRVTRHWWDWAGHLMEHSKHVRAAVAALRDVADAGLATSAGKADAVRADARSAAQWHNAVSATSRWAEGRPPFTLRDAVRPARNSYRGDNMQAILAALVDVGVLAAETVYVLQAGGEVTHYQHTGRKLP